MTLRGSATLAAAVLLDVGSMLPVALTGAAAVRIQTDLAISDAALGAAVTSFFVTGASVAVFTRRLADTKGFERMARRAALMTTASLIGIAVTAQSFWSLAVWLAVGGAAFAMMVPSTNLLVAAGAPARRLALELGAKQAAIPLALLLAGVVLPVLPSGGGWRWAFALAALLAPAGVAVLSRRGPHLSPEPLAPSAIDQPPPRRSRTRTGIIAGTTAGLASLLPGALTAFFVLNLVAIDVAEPTAGLYLAVASAGGLLARLAVGWLADRLDTEGHGLLAGMLILGGIGAAMVSSSAVPIVIAGGVVGLTFGWGWPGLLFYLVARARPDAIGEVSALAQAGGMLGAGVGPSAIAAIAAAAGWPTAWLVIAGATGLAGIVVIMDHPRAHRVVIDA